MVSLLVISIEKPKSAVRGALQRMLLEVRPGTFVGKIPSKVAKALWVSVCDNSTSAVAIFAARNEAGFVVASHGENRREIVDNFGFPLVAYRKKKSAQKS